ncbi:MAG TPA: SDR family NAD(P)-dependent oxidoreductase [Acidobacteriota bacterium]|nr:SDR family NAD(P)-dependent oxidoreductase [Acidobacteriota bacterium]
MASQSTPSRRRFDGCVAVVTGGASGIGQATAQGLAAEGASVVIGDIDREGGRRTADFIEEAGGLVRFIPTDVADAAAVRFLIEQTAETFGGLDILCNNAAYLHGTGSVTEVQQETWDKTLSVNLTGMFHCCRAALPLMMKAGRGSIVNTASVLAVVAQPNYAPYIASKGGVVQLTRAMAWDYGPHGIRVNAVCPGSIESPPVAEVLREQPEIRRDIEEKTALRRIGQCREAAAAILFLASQEASYVTGSLLFVDGGWTAT